LDIFIYDRGNWKPWWIFNKQSSPHSFPNTEEIIDKIIGGVEFVERICDGDLPATMRKGHDRAKISR
jgi:hypothetical protein